ncbi:hypothetical protein QCE63_32175 [Caballeronia sp. LZ065]|uniref:hypothetical protein n=1 Tax=Caballeronia sp. LZ065 TaxID=3038571 RepID=UPI00285AFFD0|nr:hypothetical protein [Caballeronia sp. LZ065]MDR5784079.1 hypothetical protein [Caballeronia sp. LZ065]
MKIYTCSNFTGFYPVGVAAVIVAECASAAEHLLNVALQAVGLPGDAQIDEGSAVDAGVPGIVMLKNGDY